MGSASNWGELVVGRRSLVYRLAGVTAIALALLGASLCWSGINHDEPGPGGNIHPAARKVIELRRTADQLAASNQLESARQAYENLVEQYDKSARPDVQEQVTAVKLRIGYLEAKQGNYAAARKTFLKAAQTFAGDEERSSIFGNLPDQAAYQAAVCLMAEGKTDLAAEELLRFIKERPRSPLVHAAYKRLLKLKCGDDLAEIDSATQAAVRMQEERMRLETAVCGPKVIEYIANQLGRGKAHYQDIAKYAGTTEQGTTLNGMLTALRKLGFEPSAYKLIAGDLRKLPTPAILLEADHYVAVERVSESSLHVYDPRYRSRSKLSLPSTGEPAQMFVVVTLSPINLSSEEK